MKRHAEVLILAVFVFGLIAGLSAPGAMAQEKTIVGVVTEALDIETEDGDLYAIGSNELGEEIKTLVGKKVEVTGSVLEGMYGGFTITVTAYKQIE